MMKIYINLHSVNNHPEGREVGKSTEFMLIYFLV